MAGDWIKIEAATPSKPEVDAIAEALGATVNEVVGALVRLWIWADQQTIDGNATSVTKTAIDRHSGVTGFADALLSPSISWLQESETGGFRFPNFDRHNGQTAKTRALTSKRVAACKQRKGNAEVTPGALPREEKRREENNASTNVEASAPAKPEAPAVAKSEFSFPVNSGKLWDLPQRKFDEYDATYSSRLDLPSELLKARQWLRDNPSRRKTPGGMPGFLTRWLNRAMDSNSRYPDEDEPVNWG